jgi:translation initiation factor 2 subunit 1
MPLKRSPLPEVGELVVATVQQIFEQGTYVTIDEFQGVRGYIPIVEVASTWVRHVRDYLREKQKVVLKVIRVDRYKGHVDLSLRRVSDLERQTKLMQAKRFQKSVKLLEQIAERVKISKEQAIEQIGLKLEEKSGELYAALEDVVKFGKKVLEDAAIPEQFHDTILEVAREHIHIHDVEFKGIVNASNMKPYVVRFVRDALLAG